MEKYDLPLDLNENSRERKIIDMISPSSVILEFGCSYGRLAKYLQEKKQCKIYGIEIDEEAFDCAKVSLEDGLCADIELMTWREYFKNIKFDYIIFADVLEHLKNTKEVLSVVHEFLNEDGSLIFSIPNISHADVINKLLINRFDYTDVGVLDRTHVHFWGYENLVDLCRESEFELVELDGTYCPPFLSEQRVGIVSEISRAIASKKYGDVYQFVCKAMKKTYVAFNKIGFINKIKEEDKKYRRKIKVYYDNGKGFCESNCLCVYTDFSSCVEFSVCIDETMKTVRIDPCEGCGCIIHNLQVWLDGQEIDNIYFNGTKYERYIYFDTQDPQIHISDEKVSGNGVLHVKYDIFSFEGIDCKVIFDEIFKRNQDREEFINKLKEQNDSLISDLLKEQEKNASLTEEYKQALFQKSEEIASRNKEIIAKNKELVAKQKEITSKNQELYAEKEELVIKKQELDSKEEELALKDKELKSKQEEITLKNKELVAKKEELAFKNQELAAKQEEISLKNQELKFKQEDLVTLKKELSLRNAELELFISDIKELKNEIFDLQKERILQNVTNEKLADNYENLQKEYAELQEYNEMLSKYLGEKDSVISEMRTLVVESNGAAQYANARMEKYQEAFNSNLNYINTAYDQLDMVLQSDSWKITAPVRRILRKLKNLEEPRFLSKPNLSNYIVVDTLMPVVNERPERIRKTLDSFLAQTAVEKHMVVLFLSSAPEESITTIFEYANSRVEIDCLNVEDFDVRRTLGMFQTSNYISVVYPGDTLAPNAYEVINSFIANNKMELVYTDSAYEEEGRIVETRYKPDFSIDTLRSSNYIEGMFVIHKSLIERVPEAMSFINTYDLLLKLADYASVVKHISELVYFKDINTVTHSVNEDITALENHLIRKGLRGTVLPTNQAGIYKIKYVLDKEPLVSIIIPNKDHISDLKACLNSIFKLSSYKNFEIIIIENNSTDQRTFDYYKTIKKKNVRVITFKGKFNYSKINNFGVKEAQGDYYIFLNNDVAVISPDWIQEMLMLCQRYDVGAVGAKLYYPDKRIQHAGVILGVGGVAAHAMRMADGRTNGYMNRLISVHNVTAVTGACLMMSAELFTAIDGFNEKLPVDFNDVDLCMKIRRKGMNIVFTPYAELFHNESVSRGVASTPRQLRSFAESVQRFQKDWCVELQNGDPYYNKNFTLENGDFIPNAQLNEQIVATTEEVSKAETVEEFDESKMSIAQKLNQYLDIDNYPRALEVLNHKKRFQDKKDYGDGLSIVILNLNKPELIIPLLESLVKAKQRFKQEGFVLEILVGDTGSTNKKVLEAYKKLATDVKVIYNMKYNFSKCNNEVYEKLATRKYTLFLNNDIVFPDAYASLKMMVDQYENKEIGVVGSFLFYPEKTVQHIGIDFFKTGEAAALCYHPKHMQKLERPEIGHVSYTPATTGACLMIRSELFHEIDGFDENYIEECQDVALCLATRRLGYEIVTVYTDEVLHLENATRPKGSECWKDRRYFLRKWKSFIEVL